MIVGGFNFIAVKYDMDDFVFLR